MSLVSYPQLPFLNHDILTHIFHLNTDTVEGEGGCCSLEVPDDHYSALHTTLQTSHVCRSWRQIILQSPTIWANSIDLETLREGSEYWWEEVKRRTGQAKLSIYGPVKDLSTMKRLTSLLDGTWDRVRRLDILVSEEEEFDYNEIVDNDQFWDIFWRRPAPNLEKFLLNVEMYYPIDPAKWEGLQLFTWSAPLLRHIHSPLLELDICELWQCWTPLLPQILSATLSHYLSVAETLDMITYTPLLESLWVIPTVDESDPETWTHQIHLPNLHRLLIGIDIVYSHLYLSTIAPRFDCALGLSMHEHSTDLVNSKIDTLRRLSTIVLGYAEGYFKVHPPTKLDINIENNEVRISFDRRKEAAYFGDPEFDVSLKSYIRSSPPAGYQPGSFADEVVEVLLSTLLHDALKRVRVLRLRVTHTSWSPSTEQSVNIFRAMTSVKKMELNLQCLSALNELPDSASLFPSLTKLRIIYHSRDEQLAQTLRIFLNQRQEVGIQLRALYVPGHADPDGVGHWVFLQEFGGLRIVFTGEGYVHDFDVDDEGDE